MHKWKICLKAMHMNPFHIRKQQNVSKISKNKEILPVLECNNVYTLSSFERVNINTLILNERTKFKSPFLQNKGPHILLSRTHIPCLDDLVDLKSFFTIH